VILNIKETLLTEQLNALIPSVYDQDTKVPFGVERLGAIQLLLQIVRLNKPAIHQTLSDTRILNLLVNQID
jgi:hypothetical protein